MLSDVEKLSLGYSKKLVYLVTLEALLRTSEAPHYKDGLCEYCLFVPRIRCMYTANFSPKGPMSKVGRSSHITDVLSCSYVTIIYSRSKFQGSTAAPTGSPCHVGILDGAQPRRWHPDIQFSLYLLYVRPTATEDFRVLIVTLVSIFHCTILLDQPELRKGEHIIIKSRCSDHH